MDHRHLNQFRTQRREAELTQGADHRFDRHFCLYFLLYGLAGAVTTEALMESGEAGAKLAFRIFWSGSGSLIFVFVIISCLGTLNGLMVGYPRDVCPAF